MRARLTWVAPASATFALGLWTQASAAFNVAPEGCEARPVPFALGGEGVKAAAVAVWGYENSNASEVTIPAGAENIVLRPRRHRERDRRRFAAGGPITRLLSTRRARAAYGTSLFVRSNQTAWLRLDVQRVSHRRLHTVATLMRLLSRGAHRLLFTGRLPPSIGGRLSPGLCLLRPQETNVRGRQSRPRFLRLRISG